jgi:hypothetical protein
MSEHERVTIYIVARNMDDVPELVVCEGVRTERQIRLDKSPPYRSGLNRIVPINRWPRLCWTPLDAAHAYAAGCAIGVQHARDRLSEAEEYDAGAKALLARVEADHES